MERSRDACSGWLEESLVDFECAAGKKRWTRDKDVEMPVPEVASMYVFGWSHVLTPRGPRRRYWSGKGGRLVRTGRCWRDSPTAVPLRAAESATRWRRTGQRGPWGAGAHVRTGAVAVDPRWSRLRGESWGLPDRRTKHLLSSRSPQTTFFLWRFLPLRTRSKTGGSAR